VINVCVFYYYVHIVGIKEVIDCKNARSGKLKKNQKKCVEYFAILVLA